MVELKNVTIEYEKNSGVFGVNLKILKGDFLFLSGESGAGKSTILKTIAFQKLPDLGTVRVADFTSDSFNKLDLPFIRRKVGVIFYDFKLLEEKNVFENVALGLRVNEVPRKQVKMKTLKMLSEVGLMHHAYKKCENLSAGEKQKVAIARAVVSEPYILLADEPTGNLDFESEKEIMRILKKINLRGTAILMATHKKKLIEENKNYTNIQISNGRIVD
ncbi:MAG: ATP-binding cassette domain-containing protein [Calditrichaeota bacterium]|nr:MAG: ATP-binding cassette domain-containing protein [Calditrichota bacterium]